MLSIMPIFYKLFLTNLKFLSLKDVAGKFDVLFFWRKYFCDENKLFPYENIYY